MSIFWNALKSRLVAVIIACVALPSVGSAATVSDDGLHVQPWFAQTFLVLKEDLEEAAAEGKRLAIIFEQKGCPYCREMHQVNLKKAEIVDYIKEHYKVIQLNMWGSRAVTDLDGKEMEERELARRWRVHFTPTIVFLATPQEMSDGVEEVMRMPGYFKPFHFHTMFEYVVDQGYKSQDFQKYLQEKFRRLEEEGKKPEIW